MPGNRRDGRRECGGREGPERPFRRRRTVLVLAAVLGACLVNSGCAALSKMTYYEPRTPAAHETKSPFSGNPAGSFGWFGSPSNVLTVNGDGYRVGVLAWNSAHGFTWMGPLLPILPIPVNEKIDTNPIRVWIAVVADEDVAVSLAGFRLRSRDPPLDLLPVGVWDFATASLDTAAVAGPHPVPAGKWGTWNLEYHLPGDSAPEPFELVIMGIATERGPGPPAVVEFRLVRGWRFLTMP